MQEIRCAVIFKNRAYGAWPWPSGDDSRARPITFFFFVADGLGPSLFINDARLSGWVNETSNGDLFNYGSPLRWPTMSWTFVLYCFYLVCWELLYIRLQWHSAFKFLYYSLSFMYKIFRIGFPLMFMRFVDLLLFENYNDVIFYLFIWKAITEIIVLSKSFNLFFFFLFLQINNLIYWTHLFHTLYFLIINKSYQ